MRSLKPSAWKTSIYSSGFFQSFLVLFYLWTPRSATFHPVSHSQGFGSRPSSQLKYSCSRKDWYKTPHVYPTSSMPHHSKNDYHNTHHRLNLSYLPLLWPPLLEQPILRDPSEAQPGSPPHTPPQPLWTSWFVGTKRDPCTYCCRIIGMFTQLAAATAAKGTQRPTRGGALCWGKGTIGVIQAHCKMGVEGLKDHETINQTLLLPKSRHPTPSKDQERPTWGQPCCISHSFAGLWPYPTHPDWGNA